MEVGFWFLPALRQRLMEGSTSSIIYALNYKKFVSSSHAHELELFDIKLQSTDKVR